MQVSNYFNDYIKKFLKSESLNSFIIEAIEKIKESSESYVFFLTFDFNTFQHNSIGLRSGE